MVGAPNITGYFGIDRNKASSKVYQFLTDGPSFLISEGPFSFSTETKQSSGINHTDSDWDIPTKIQFDASKSSSIYSNVPEVRPENSTIKIWKRTA